MYTPASAVAMAESKGPDVPDAAEFANVINRLQTQGTRSDRDFKMSKEVRSVPARCTRKYRLWRTCALRGAPAWAYHPPAAPRMWFG